MYLSEFERTSHYLWCVKKCDKTIAWFENEWNAKHFAKSKNLNTKTRPYIVVEVCIGSNRSSFRITEELKKEVKWFASAFKEFEEELKKMGFGEDTISKIAPFFASRWCTSTLGDWLHSQLCVHSNDSIFDLVQTIHGIVGDIEEPIYDICREIKDLQATSDAILDNQ